MLPVNKAVVSTILLHRMMTFSTIVLSRVLYLSFPQVTDVHLHPSSRVLHPCGHDTISTVPHELCDA